MHLLYWPACGSSPSSRLETKSKLLYQQQGHGHRATNLDVVCAVRCGVVQFSRTEKNEREWRAKVAERKDGKRKRELL